MSSESSTSKDEEDDEELKRMEELAIQYFDDEKESDVYFPVVSSVGGKMKSEFYPGKLKDSFESQSKIPQCYAATARKSCCYSTEGFLTTQNCNKCFVLFLGISGGIIFLSALTAYCIAQIPSIRQMMGPSYVNWNETIAQEFPNPRMIYGIELALVLSTLLIGIAVNVLLVYGVIARNKGFFVPWLVFHALVILTSIVLFILVMIKANPAIFRLLALIPLFVTLFLVFSWIKLVDFYHALKKEKLRQRVVLNGLLGARHRH